MPRVTMQTLADDLGVSRVTISNAFNRPDQLYRGAAYLVPARRLDGVRRELQAAGLPWEPVPVVECARSDLDAGALATWELLDRADPPTAVVAFSDQLALGALRRRTSSLPHETRFSARQS